MLAAVNAKVQIEIDGGRVLLVLDRRHDCILVTWQDAIILAATIDQAIKDLPSHLPIDKKILGYESGQIRLAKWKGMVAILFEHTDRVRFAWYSAKLVSNAIKLTAQDVELASRGVHLRYDRFGEPFPTR